MNRSLLCAMTLVVACSAPCPEGMVHEDDHCVAEEPNPIVTPPAETPSLDVPPPITVEPEDAAAGGAMRDGGTPAPDAEPIHIDFDAAQHDGAASSDAEPPIMDASVAEGGIDAHLSDAGLESGAPSDASNPDGAEDALAPDAVADTAVEDGGDSALPDAQVTDICSDDDLGAWRAFLASEQLPATIAECMAGGRTCVGAACDLPGCLRQAAGVSGCAQCALAETQCTAKACAAACRSSNASDACRACACSHGCVGQSDACGMGSVDICADCSGDTCALVSLDPALIMVIIDSAF